MGRKRKRIKTEKEKKEEVKVVMDQPRRVGNKMSWISWKSFEAES